MPTYLVKVKSKTEYLVPVEAENEFSVLKEFENWIADDFESYKSHGEWDFDVVEELNG